MTLFIKIILLTTCLKTIGSQGNVDICQMIPRLAVCGPDNYRKKYYYDLEMKICTEDPYFDACLDGSNGFVSLEECIRKCPMPLDGEHENRPDDGHENRPVDGHENRPDDGNENVPDDGHENRPDDGHENRPDDGHENRPDGEHENRPDNEHENRPDNEHENRPDNAHENNPNLSPCDAPVTAELCKGSIFHYQFVPDLNRCLLLFDDQCPTSPNAFITKEECEQRCIEHLDVCQIQQISGDCGPDKFRKKYFFDLETKQCMKSQDMGICYDGSNSFGSLAECRRKCLKVENVCKVKPQSGTCDPENNNAYYYYALKNKCKKFRNNKCGISENRFLTKKRCEDQCSKEVCTIEPKTFKCKHKKKKSMYFFDPEDMKCKKYNKKKCPKTLNKFKTEKQCMKVCSPTIEKPEVDEKLG